MRAEDVMRILSALLLLCCGALLSTTGAQPKPAPYDFGKAKESLFSFLADKHAGLGDDYRDVKLFVDARKQYDRARALVPDHFRAMKGLGFEKKRGEWVLDKPLPEKDDVEPLKLEETRKKPDLARAKEYERCADRCRRAVEEAAKGSDEKAARILCAYLLVYAPADEEAHKRRGHIKEGETWMPDFAHKWRAEGQKIYTEAGEGNEHPGEDEQAKLIETKFFRRKSELLVARTSLDEARAKSIHKGAEAHMKRSMELLGVTEHPFGKGRHYTLTQVNKKEYDATLTKILKLEGEQLEFNKRTQGTGMPQPWGFITRSTAGGADDMIGNTIALRVLTQARGYQPETAHWLSTGFSYLLTSQVLGTVSTVRYSMERSGATSTNRNVIPDFTKKSGTPDYLREAALFDAMFGADMPLDKIVRLEVNDIDLGAAAKAFSFFEFAFERHRDQAVKWLRGAPAKPPDRAAAIEAAFGKPLSEIEAEWRQWVLERY
jgi:hypothetical protein